MKTIRIALTSERRILAIGCPTAIAALLRTEERIVNNWYYNQPRELESFLKLHPEKENDILKAFSYWVMSNLMGFKEKQNHYGTIKRELQKFSHQLFKELRLIAGRIARDIHNFLFPQPQKIKIVY